MGAVRPQVAAARSEAPRAAGIGQRVELLTASGERETGREAALGEDRPCDVAELDLERGLLEHRDEGTVRLPEALAHVLARGVAWRLRRALAPRRALEGILMEDLPHATRWVPSFSRSAAAAVSISATICATRLRISALGTAAIRRTDRGG